MSKKVLIETLLAVAGNRPEGYVDAVFAKAVEKTDSYVALAEADYFALKKQFPPLREPSGPGVELKKLLKKIGIVATPGCACNKRAAYMDKMGCDWCAENIEQICDWLNEEADRRKLPFFRLGAKVLVKRAISNARKKGQ